MARKRSWVYYNDNNIYCVKWLRGLIKSGHLPPGDVDPRPIERVKPDDLKGFTQCHFFAGIGGWPLALKWAGWPEDEEIWTGSCPCQPFSIAGKRRGKDDPRHLWPYFHSLIREVRPPHVMGEQVAGKDGYGWFTGVQTDLEESGYLSRALDIPACGVNAPQVRNRIYWAGRLGNSTESGLQIRRGKALGGKGREEQESKRSGCVPKRVSVEWMGNSSNPRLQRRQLEDLPGTRRRKERGAVTESGGTHLAIPGECWSECAVIGPDKEGFYRRVKPGIQLVANGISRRVDQIRAIGNAISPVLAAEVVRAYMESLVEDGIWKV